ncbi:MAG TPA: NUDIX hydrolase [Candidatus Woesebacteria bacterium]|nr:NUDIX hydrolase [Candidatus Woesebacteria bacterium]HPR99280.1 NUDIX hydrolase [Candidatus Woesebacteria bacterium]
MSHSPWQTLSSKIVYQNSWIKIHEDKVIRPDGREGLYAFLSKPAAVFILAKNKDGFFYFIRQYRYPLKKYIYEIPAGVVDDQSFLTNAKRELKEETGLVAEKWVSLGKFYIAPGHENVSVHSFLALNLNENLLSKKNQEGDESIQKIIKLSLSQVKKYISSGKIECGITLATWNLYQNSKFYSN